MLKLKNIKKTYVVSSDMKVEALKGVSLNFRKNEFVSILGPSGCGKTTLLNIIGGLDKYTDGDLFISGKSTKNFNDRDWDVYRNHRIGFIFQSYNLIPHQTILGNVELALTISGLGKEERQKKAKEALDKVGLSGQYNKKPNQLSGGQCQRVAIARALVNEPEILLADEPTGALDTVTSVQIMELIKEIANEKLVIMVTHNPELAEKYSSRIVRLLDGEVIEDSNPYSEDEEQKEVDEVNAKEKAQYEILTLEEKKTVKKQQNRAKMSFFTAFRLSARNLYSKLKRTIMVVVAGSIGIIGVSAVLAVSQGVRDYIVDIQDDLLSGNPIAVTKTAYDLDTIMNASSTSQKIDYVKNGDYVGVNSIISYLAKNRDALTSLVHNNEFTLEYVDYIKSMPKEYYNAIGLNYDINITPMIYTDFKVHKSDETSTVQSLHSITSNYTAEIQPIIEYIYKDNPELSANAKTYSELLTNLSTVMSQAIPNNDYILSQYDILDGGHLPQNENEIILVLDNKNSVNDLVLAQIGYFTQDQFLNNALKALDDNKGVYKYKEDLVVTKYSYDEIKNKTFYLYNNDDIYYQLPSTFPQYGGMFMAKYLQSDLPETAKPIELKVSAIVKPKEGISYGALSSGFLYTEDLARTIIKNNINSKLANYVREKEAELANYSQTDPEYYKQYASLFAGYLMDYINYDFTDMDQTGYPKETTDRRLSTIGSNSSGLTSTAMAYFTGGSASSPLSINSVGGSYLPSSIHIYPINFEKKDLVTNYLNKWNTNEDLTAYKFDIENTYKYEIKDGLATYTISGVDRAEIKYTDSVSIIIGLINTMIDIVTYALVAFTALSLIVSTVMVAIITYVSVVERVKEIGVIRSLGGRKKDVSHLFNAETFIIGLSSGVFGVVFTYIMQLIANVAINAASGGSVAKIANLTPATAIIMILVSIILTAISGIIPARSAARKDPVVALRTE